MWLQMKKQNRTLLIGAIVLIAGVLAALFLMLTGHSSSIYPVDP